MVCSRNSLMNGRELHDRSHNPSVGGKIENQPKRRSQVRGRWGGRLFALGGVLLLAGGLSLGAWGNYAQQQQVMATAKQTADSVPSLQVATVKPSPGTVSV